MFSWLKRLFKKKQTETPVRQKKQERVRVKVDKKPPNWAELERQQRIIELMEDVELEKGPLDGPETIDPPVAINKEVDKPNLHLVSSSTSTKRDRSDDPDRCSDNGSSSSSYSSGSYSSNSSSGSDY